MASANQLRISVWPGGCLWIGRTLQPFDGEVHAHHAIQLSFLLNGKLTFRSGADECSDAITLIDADVPHSLSVDGCVAHLFIDPEASTGRALREQLPIKNTLAGASDPVLKAAWETLARLWHDEIKGDALRVEAAALIERICGPRLVQTLDNRIQRMIATIERQPPGPIDFATASAGIYYSPSRLRHLFAEQVGLPFKSYVLWRRLMKAVDALGCGSSITIAAHDAGFADGAHFSRTFRRTFGLSANALEQL